MTGYHCSSPHRKLKLTDVTASKVEVDRLHAGGAGPSNPCWAQAALLGPKQPFLGPSNPSWAGSAGVDTTQRVTKTALHYYTTLDTDYTDMPDARVSGVTQTTLDTARQTAQT